MPRPGRGRRRGSRRSYWSRSSRPWRQQRHQCRQDGLGTGDDVAGLADDEGDPDLPEAVAEAACPLAAVEHGAACVLVALDRKRGDLFVQPFSASRQSLTAPAIVAADDVAAHLYAAGVKRDEIVAVAGDAAAITCTALAAAGYAVRMVDACRFPTALSVARLAAARWLAGDRAPAPPRPLYLRPADTGPPMAPAPRAGERSRASG